MRSKFQLQQEQKRARFELGYTQSLLAGSPATPMTIAENQRLSDEDRTRQKQAAMSRMRSSNVQSLLDSKDNVSPPQQRQGQTYLEIVNALQVNEAEMTNLEKKIHKKEKQAKKLDEAGNPDELAHLRIECDRCKASNSETLERLSNNLREEKDKKIVDSFRGDGNWLGRGNTKLGSVKKWATVKHCSRRRQQ